MRRLFPGLLVLLLLLSGCGASEPAERQFFAMDTVMSVTLYGPDGQAAADLFQQEMNRLERLWSRTDEKSEISQLNAHAGDGRLVPLSPETLALLAQAQKTSAQSGGAFNPLIAPVMDVWGFTGETYRVPGESELGSLLPLLTPPAELDTENAAGRLVNEGQELDLGGSAKGQAAQLAAAAILDAYPKLTGGILRLGGNITAFGSKPRDQSFTVAVQDPLDTAQYLCTFPLSGSCATSGGYERYFEQDGVRYHHIIDPATGYPADSGLVSATVAAPAALTDPWSTAFFVMGAERALEFWKTDPAAEGMELILVTEDKHVYVTEGLKKGFQFLGEERGYTYEFVSR